jgi:ADP-glucose pyrophosphorylase
MPAAVAGDYSMYGYDFTRNQLPGIQPYEERIYWRDVGTLEALEQARSDAAGTRPRFDLRNRAWPIRRDLLPSAVRPNAVGASDRCAA